MAEYRTLVLAGNPNSGKTTLFNGLTGAQQRVGNWPGVTVERKEGWMDLDGVRTLVVDLPGSYGLSAVTMDEAVARDYLVRERPDAVVQVIDASNLSRNLYLTIQLLELRVPLIVALNMCDEVEARGDRIDFEQMARLLRVPVVRTIGNRGEGIRNLAMVARRNMEDSRLPLEIRYSEPVTRALARIEEAVRRYLQLPEYLQAHWLALKLLEGDYDVFDRHPVGGEMAPVQQVVAAAAEEIELHTGQPADMSIVDDRHSLIRGLVRECVRLAPRDRRTLTERLDAVILNRILAFPIFLFALWLTFQFTFFVGQPFMNLIEYGITLLSQGLEPILTAWPVWLAGFVTNGMIGGIGSLLVFFPNIFLLFIAISFLEDSGYMSRAAFVVDRFMHKIGLHGKSFIPLIIGFGCTVPAILATRTLESRRDRIITIMIAPFVSCGARMPIWVLLAGAFFPARHAGSVIFGIILLGLVVAALSALLLSRLIKGETAPFVMELPPYRMPTLKSLLRRTWQRSWLFLRKVGTVILIGVIIIWFLGTFPWGVEPNSEASYAGQLGHIMEPVTRTIGIDWRGAVALTFGFVAKEIVVSSLGVLFDVQNGESVEDQSFQTALRSRLRESWTPLQALSFMVFALLYMPCIATLGAVFRELGDIKLGFAALFYGLGVAYLLALAVYQGGRLAGFS